MIKELLQPDLPRVVYDIRLDTVGVAKMSRASRSSGDWGLALDYGIVGSETWWLAIEAEKLKLQSFVGIIRLVAGGMGDTLEVHIEGAGGTQRWIAWRGFTKMLNGKKVCIRYVEMRPKKPIASRPDFLVPVLLQVEVLD